MNTSVLMFCSQFRPLVGGAERQAEKLAIALVAAGCRVKILTPHIDPNSPQTEELEGVIIERFRLVDLACRFPIPGIALVNIPYIFWQIAKALWPQLKDTQIVHCHIASVQTAAAALTARARGIPVLCKAAMADSCSDLGEIEKQSGSGRMVAWLVRSFVDLWVGTTSAVVEALTQAGLSPNSIVKIPNGVALSSPMIDRPLQKGARRFLYLGRLSTNAQRDVRSLIKAFDQLALHYQDIELAVVGEGDLYEESRRQVADCLAKARIFLPGLDIPEKWLMWADCFVLPSRREGLSNALLEAMAAGLACIANDIPPNREVLEDGKAGLLVPVEDESALRRAMQAMVETKGLASRYAQKARERVEQCYSISAVASQYIELYSDLCKKEAMR